MFYRRYTFLRVGGSSAEQAVNVTVSTWRCQWTQTEAWPWERPCRLSGGTRSSKTRRFSSCASLSLVTTSSTTGLYEHRATCEHAHAIWRHALIIVTQKDVMSQRGNTISLW